MKRILHLASIIGCLWFIGNGFLKIDLLPKLSSINLEDDIELAENANDIESLKTVAISWRNQINQLAWLRNNDGKVEILIGILLLITLLGKSFVSLSEKKK